MLKCIIDQGMLRKKLAQATENEKNIIQIFKPNLYSHYNKMILTHYKLVVKV